MIRRQLADMAAKKGKRKGGKERGGWGRKDNKNEKSNLDDAGETSASIVRES